MKPLHRPDAPRPAKAVLRCESQEPRPEVSVYVQWVHVYNVGSSDVSHTHSPAREREGSWRVFRAGSPEKTEASNCC